jgi:hypothetical protein
MDEEDKLNNVMAAGAILACLWMAKGRTDLQRVEVVCENGAATNQIDVWLGFLKSPYRVTVQRIEEKPGELPPMAEVPLQ